MSAIMGFLLFAIHFNNVAQSPPLGLANSKTNFMQRTFTWPAGKNSVSFDYIVDTEPGHDFFRFHLDGVEQDLDPYVSGTQGISGLNKAGRRSIAVPAGPHTIRFSYVKDADHARGRDLVIVDNVHFVASALGGIVESHSFDETDSLAAQGWTVGGDNGGFILGRPATERSAGRPKEQYGQDSTNSSMYRAINWPVCNPACAKWRGGVEFEYFVDSEPKGDFLNAYVDEVKQDLDRASNEVQGISGRNRYGRGHLRVTKPGPHTIRFEYAKDSKTSEGRDTARVDRIRFIDGNGRILEYHDFTGRDLGADPIVTSVRGQTVPAPLREWTGPGKGGQGAAWVVHRLTPPVVYVPMQTTGSKLRPEYRTFAAAPVVNGHVLNKDYPNVTKIQLFNYANPNTGDGSLSLIGHQNTNSLYIGFIGRSRTPAEIGNERGTLVVYFDDNRTETLRDTTNGACADARWPGPEDRRINISYALKKGATGPAAIEMTEQKGTCDSSVWAPLTAETAWIADPLADVKVQEPVFKAVPSGSVHIEVRVTMPAGGAAIANGVVGFGLKRTNVLFSASEERFPHGVYGGPAAQDVYSWATLRLSHPSRVNAYDQGENRFSSMTPWPDRTRFTVFR